MSPPGGDSNPQHYTVPRRAGALYPRVGLAYQAQPEKVVGSGQAQAGGTLGVWTERGPAQTLVLGQACLGVSKPRESSPG